MDQQIKNKKPFLSIIILNYKSSGLVKQCLKGLYNLHIGYLYEIIVVDNDSRDEIESMLQKNFPQVKFIKADKNRGFAAGNNLGLKKAQGEYLLVLNPDIAVLEGALEKMVDFLQNNEKVGMVVPKLLNPDHTVQNSLMRWPTILMPFYRRTFLGKSKRAKKLTNWYLMKDRNPDKNQPIEWALGACMMVKRKAVNEIGFFDERYFLYVEDTDWCRRFWQAGWKIYYVADAKMIHYHMRESARKFLSKLNFIHIASWIKYFWKFRKKQIKHLTD